MVMLDRSLCLRRITPAVNQIMKATAFDIGRPLADIKLNIEPSDLKPRKLEQMITNVLDSLQAVEREVRDLDCWHRLSEKKQLPMWHRYRVELYPHVLGFGLGPGNPGQVGK